MSDPIYISFDHGLGDCANFMIAARVYRDIGYDLRVICEQNKLSVFAAGGVPAVERKEAGAILAHNHPWWESGQIENVTAKNIFAENKTHINIRKEPLPQSKLPHAELWSQFSSTHAALQHSFDQYRDNVDKIIADLPRPIVLIHSNGNTSANRKDMPAAFPQELTQQILEKTDGSVIFLDWDNRTNWVHSSRTRHILYHYGKQLSSVENLMGLCATADLLVGIDSGPFHLAGVIDMPSIGLWFKHHPARYVIPRQNCLNIVEKYYPVNLWGADVFNTVTTPISVDVVFSTVQKMLAAPKFKLPIGQDVQFQMFLDKCAGGITKHVVHVPNVVVDRNRSFSKIFEHLCALGRPPRIVETGCIRADNDWAGAGYSTFLFGLFAQRFNGKLDSVDLTPKHVDYARSICAAFPAVKIHQSDSVAFLSSLAETVDCVYLDSMDTYVAGHAEHGLNEAKKSVEKVATDGLIVFDDTLWSDGKFLGKGALGVPWLLDNGWRILFAGHQVVLKRA